MNLPAREKASPPRYQDILKSAIPVVNLPEAAGSMRVIAGAYNQTSGPAKTVTPMNIWDVKLQANANTSFDLPTATNTLIILLHGQATVNEAELTQHQGTLLSQDGERVTITAADHGATLIILNGEPIDEPVVAHGPFVMNSSEEIRQAVADYHAGRMGQLQPPAGS